MTTQWRKSSFSDDGQCVEWAYGPRGIEVRDSKDPEGPTLTFTAAEWAAFVRGVRAGEAGPPE